MVFTQTTNSKIVIGDKRVHFGTWTATGVSTGDLDTGLKVCENVYIYHTGSGAEAKHGVINTALPAPGNAITLICESGDVGIWIAEGW